MKFDNLVMGIFVEESKNRFICKVLINDLLCECYVPSSSRIQNYLNIKGKEVLLSLNNGKNQRTKYALFAVKYYNKYVLLNLNLLNKIVEAEILQDCLIENIIIKKEQVIEGYKTDLLLEYSGGGKTIIEVKGIISTRRVTKFPSVHSERAISQLKRLRELLLQGYKVLYYLVSLSPIVKKIELDPKFQDYCDLLRECVELGMELIGFSLMFEKGTIKCKQNVSIS